MRHACRGGGSGYPDVLRAVEEGILQNGTSRSRARRVKIKLQNYYFSVVSSISDF